VILYHNINIIYTDGYLSAKTLRYLHTSLSSKKTC